MGVSCDPLGRVSCASGAGAAPLPAFRHIPGRSPAVLAQQLHGYVEGLGKGLLRERAIANAPEHLMQGLVRLGLIEALAQGIAQLVGEPGGDTAMLPALAAGLRRRGLSGLLGRSATGLLAGRLARG